MGLRNISGKKHSKVSPKKEHVAVVKQKQQKGYIRRAIKNAQPKIVENSKSVMFIRSTTTNQLIMDVMKDLVRMKKPNCKVLSKKNSIRPFEEINSLEFLSKKNECSLFMVGSNSKKRPNNVILGRFFNYQLLDMIELGIENYQSIDVFKTVKSQVGQKPMFIFQSDLFQYSAPHILLKNLLLDFFRGEEVDSINLSGLSHVISVTAIGDEKDEKPKVFFRVYACNYSRIGGIIPRVDLELMGPSMDMEIRRIHENTSELKKNSLRVPRTIKPKKVKNVTHSIFGEKIGRVHMTKQAVDKMQVRKIKALKILRKERKQNEKKRDN